MILVTRTTRRGTSRPNDVTRRRLGLFAAAAAHADEVESVNQGGGVLWRGAPLGIVEPCHIFAGEATSHVTTAGAEMADGAVEAALRLLRE